MNHSNCFRSFTMFVIFCLISVGCGIPLDDAPREIAAEQLDDELKLAQAPTAVAELAPQFDLATFLIYLIDENGLLKPVERPLPSNSGPTAVIQALLEGPSADESEANLSTALADDLPVTSVTNSGTGTVVVDITSEAGLASLSTSEQRVAIGQLVYTVTRLQTVSSFRLQINGENVSVPTDGDDSTADEPVSVDDYASLAPLEELEEEEAEADAPVVPSASMFEVFLVDDDGLLTAVQRSLPGDVGPNEVIRALLEGPLVSEENLTSALASDVAVSSVTSTGTGTVVIDLASDLGLASLSTGELRVAIAQLANTVTQLPTISSLRVQVNGRNVSLPTDDGNTVPDEPVSPDNYPSLSR